MGKGAEEAFHQGSSAIPGACVSLVAYFLYSVTLILSFGKM
ncbi:hypothetical protein LEP1GSC109_0019 [Leptospira interrogans str. UI 13372]|nr:hypothetical protein LEP1GSC109_0019 [Leptospira interrogans str. UI 13372]